MPGRNFTDAEEEQIAKIYLAGHSIRAIAKAYGLNHHISISAALQRQGIKKRSASARNRKYTLNPNIFGSLDAELPAYWLGFLYADCTPYKNTIRVALKRADNSHLTLLRQFLESNTPIHNIEGNCSNGKTYPQAYIEFSGVRLMNRLKTLGIVKGRLFPERMISNIPDIMVHHCIRGYFDGDGSAQKSRVMSICGDQTLLAWIRKLVATKMGTNPNLKLHKHPKSNIYYLNYSGRLQALKFADYIYQDATIWLKRKRDVVLSWPQERYRLGRS